MKNDFPEGNIEIPVGYLKYPTGIIYFLFSTGI